MQKSFIKAAGGEVYGGKRADENAENRLLHEPRRCFGSDQILRPTSIGLAHRGATLLGLFRSEIESCPLLARNDWA